MAEEQSTLERVKQILSDTLGIDDKDVTDDVKFSDLDIDSLDMIELVSEAEDQFDVELADVSGIETPAQLAAYIDKTKAGE